MNLLLREKVTEELWGLSPKHQKGRQKEDTAEQG